LRNKIAYYRSKKGWTQIELANKLGISPFYLNKIERGKKDPSIRLAIRIARYLEVRLDDLFFDDEFSNR
jgi:putative transcriptional regulator